MNWSRIKTIMIFFLIGMNVFMITFVSVTAIRASIIPNNIIDASCSILEKDSFEFDKEVIPSKCYTLPTLDAKFYTASELSDLLFKKQLAFRTVEDSLVAKEGRATLTVSENHFLYESGYTAKDSFSPHQIKRALEKVGINMKGSVYDKRENCFYYMYKNVNLFNMYIRAKLDDDGEICYLSAQWPSSFKAQKNKRFSFSESLLKVKDAFPKGGKIKAIEPGYALHFSSNKYIFSPAWRINVDDQLTIIE